MDQFPEMVRSPERKGNTSLSLDSCTYISPLLEKYYSRPVYRGAFPHLAADGAAHS